MVLCHAFTTKFKPCRGNALAPSRLCHIHHDWYKNTKWLPYMLCHISPYCNFKWIIRILNDPFAIYYPNGSISCFEMYLDILFECAPINTRNKVILLYEVGTRCKRLKPSDAQLLWNYSLRQNIQTCIQYYENSLRPYYPEGFKHIIVDVITPLLYMESFQNYIHFVNMMLTRSISWSAMIYFIECTINYIDPNSVLFHEKVNYLDAALEFEVSIMKKVSFLTTKEKDDAIHLANELFKYILTMCKNIGTRARKSIDTRIKLLKDELLAVVYHPDNFQRLIAIESLATY